MADQIQYPSLMLSSLNLLEKRRLYLNRSFKPLKSPQPVLLDSSYFFLSSRLHPLTDKPMVITKPVSTCFHISNRPLPFHLHLHEISKFLDSET